MAQQGLNIAQSSAESLANFNFSPSVSLVPGLSVGYGALPAQGAGTTLFGAGTTSTVAAGTGSVATTTTVAGVSTTTTTTQIGSSGFNMSYNPTMLYITAAMMAYQAYQAALACDEEDYKSSTKGKAKLCYDTGTWCESKDCGLFGCTCTKYRTGKCCYNSKLARIINQQGRAQLGLDIRACDGFTVAQIQQLDWSRIDLTEFIADMLAQAQQSAGAVMNTTTQTGLQNKLTTSTKANGAAKMQPNLPISQ
jgi:conjugal transfer mating pair stabilization protein TraN